MSKNSFLWKDDQLNINSRLLTMFSAPLTVWITGVIYYCKNEISIFGREPLPINSALLLTVILLGYLMSIIIIAIIPRFTVWIQRILLPLTTVAILLLLFPFPSDVAVKLFYAVVCAAHFSIVMSVSIICHLFTVESAWKSAAMSIGIGGFFLAILRNDVFTVSFTLFIFTAAIMLIIATGFLYIIPGRIKVPFATWRDKVKLPFITFFGILFLIGLSSMLCVFSVSFASKVYHGLSFLFGSAAIFSMLTLFVWMLLGSKAIKSFIIFFVLIIAGIALAYFSATYKHLYLFACVFLGFTISVASTWTFLVSTAFSMHPTRFIGIIGTMINVSFIILGTYIYRLCSSNHMLLYCVFGGTAILLTFTYLILHKYFVYAFESHTLGSNIKLVGRPFSLPHKVQTSRQAHPFDELSEIELMVVKLILEGHILFSVALNMSVDMETAKEYKRNLYKKLDIHSKLGLFHMVSKHPYEF